MFPGGCEALGDARAGGVVLRRGKAAEPTTPITTREGHLARGKGRAPVPPPPCVLFRAQSVSQCTVCVFYVTCKDLGRSCDDCHVCTHDDDLNDLGVYLGTVAPDGARAVRASSQQISRSSSQIEPVAWNDRRRRVQQPKLRELVLTCFQTISARQSKAQSSPSVQGHLATVRSIARSAPPWETITPLQLLARAPRM